MCEKCHITAGGNSVVPCVVGQLSCMGICSNTARVNSVVWDILQHSQGQCSCVGICSKTAIVNSFVWEHVPTQQGLTQSCGNMLQHSQGQLSCVGTCPNTARVNSIVWELPQHSQSQLSCAPTQTGSTQLCGAHIHNCFTSTTKF